MLTKEENDLLTQTGRGTPCGDFMRRYWQPVLLSEELPPGGRPVPARLLGEDLVVFRDGQGQLGVLGRWCSHRGTDLSAGYAEDAGIRCGYHGWLYDIRGRCLEQPLEPPESTFCEEIQHPAYPAQEQAGIIFAYLGPDEPPLLPAYEFLGVPDEQRRSTKYLQECNYLQGNEGSLDPLQVWVLEQAVGEGNVSRAACEIDDPTVEPEETEYGVRLVSLQKGEGDNSRVEVREFFYPNLCAMPGIGIDGYALHWHVPIDDTHHWRYVIAFRRDAALSEDQGRANGVHPMPNYKVERAGTREDLRTSYIVYSTMIAESQGPVYDRTHEQLQPSDGGIVAMRTAIYWGIQDVQEGNDPPHLVRSADENDFSHVDVLRQDVAAGDDWRSLVSS
jgi:nitrite reductase/ring-hydroxylating ferredoxin subunit